MPYNYGAGKAQAKRLLDRYGGAGQVVLKGVTGGFDEKGNPTPDTPDTTIDGVISPLLRYTSSEVDGTTIQRNDAFVLWQSLNKVVIDMHITLNNQTFRIINVMEFSSVAGEDIFAQLQLR